MKKEKFLAELTSQVEAHLAEVRTTFQPLEETLLTWRPAPKEWSILICFDHLNQTYLYYQEKIERAIATPTLVKGSNDEYHPSFWGNIYMYFALNPKWSFPTPAALMPALSPERSVLEKYQANQLELVDLFHQLDQVDLKDTRVPIEKGVSFNLGDCLKILVYHDSLHIRQAHKVLADYQFR
jgi:hypothetical protein